MEQRKVSLSETAYNNLESIEAYIAQDLPTIARNFISLIFDRIERIAMQNLVR
jgi:plasmid stabilization system protein ParE